MTTQKTNIQATIVAPKTYAEIVTGAVGTGYTMQFKRDSKTPWYARCENCKDINALVFAGNELTQYKTIHACTCGYRKFFSTEIKFKDVSDKQEKICRKKTCSNPVPEGRDAYCFTCRPKPQTVDM